MLLRRRLGIAAAVVLAVVIGAGVLFIQSQPYRSEREVGAVVRIAYVNHNSDTGQRYMHIEAQLDGGQIVLATGLVPMPPARGTRIVLRERVSWMGFPSYQWEGITK